jgi:adenylate cyclase class IV
MSEQDAAADEKKEPEVETKAETEEELETEVEERPDAAEIMRSLELIRMAPRPRSTPSA